MQLIDLAIGLVAASMFTRIQETFQYVIHIALATVRWEQSDMYSQPPL
jgi:hypothetical protein